MSAVTLYEMDEFNRIPLYLKAQGVVAPVRVILPTHWAVDYKGREFIDVQIRVAETAHKFTVLRDGGKPFKRAVYDNTMTVAAVCKGEDDA